MSSIEDGRSVESCHFWSMTSINMFIPVSIRLIRGKSKLRAELFRSYFRAIILSKARFDKIKVKLSMWQVNSPINNNWMAGHKTRVWLCYNTSQVLFYKLSFNWISTINSNINLLEQSIFFIIYLLNFVI